MKSVSRGDAEAQCEERRKLARRRKDATLRKKMKLFPALLHGDVARYSSFLLLRGAMERMTKGDSHSARDQEEAL